MKDIVTVIRSNPEAYAPQLMQQAADEIELLRIGVATALKERDEARRQYCRGFTDFCPNPKHDELSLEEAAMLVAKEFEWDCFDREQGK